jgi:hypothetical protein
MSVHDVNPSRRAIGAASNRESVAWSSTLLSRPSGGIAESIGARQVSWLATYRRRRLPRLEKKPSGSEKRRHAAHSRGGGHGSTKGLPCSLFTLGRNRGTVRRSCSSLETGCQMERRPLSRAAKPENPAASVPGLLSRLDPNIEDRPARTSAGRSSSGLGGEPRGPNNVRSSHNAVILASATTGLRVRTEFSASAETFSAPNNVSAKRRSISCCRRASASFVGHCKDTLEEGENLALTAMRFEACTTAGAQTASEARPRRNCRRGATREPTVRIPRRS